jgi:hypothetical protein
MPAVWRGHRLLLPEPDLIRVCLNSDEKDKIRRYCRARGLSYSQFLRALALSYIDRSEGERSARECLEEEAP